MANSDYPNRSSNYSGIWVPMITPFKNGDVDYDAADLFTRHLVDAGVHGLVVCGTTGEGPSLSIFEKARLLDTVAASVPSHIPVFMGVEGANTAQVITELSELGDRSISGFLLAAPSYMRPSQEGIYRHFMAIADAVNKPVMLYDIPERTGVSISVDTIERLLENGAFPAIKACGLSADRLKSLIQLPNLEVMCGDDLWIHRAFELGAHGAISASAQVLPRRFIETYSLIQKIGIEPSWKRFSTLVPLIQHMFGEPNPAPVKAALASQGWCREELRLPMVPITPSYREALNRVLRDMHALDHEELICADKSFK